MSVLSILIPCVGPAVSFEDTLCSVLENRPAACEVLVVQPRPYDDPYGLRGEVHFVEGSQGSSLLRLINLGIRHSAGSIVHVLQCGMRATDGWTARVRDHFFQPDVASVAPLWIEDRHSRRLTTAGIRATAGGGRRDAARGWPIDAGTLRRLRIDGPTLSAGFYRRDLLLALDGFQEDVGDMADLDWALSAEHLGFRAVVEPDSLVCGLRTSPLATAYQSGLWSERFFRRHARYGRFWKGWLAHPGSVLAESLRRRPWMVPAHCWGRLAASYETRPNRLYHELLELARGEMHAAPVAGAVGAEERPAIRRAA